MLEFCRGGLTLLNSILQLYLANAIAEKTTIDGWTVIKYADGTCEGYKDVTINGSLAQLVSTVGYIEIPAQTFPSAVTLEAVTAELIRTNGFGWISRMAASAPSAAFRFLTYQTSGARTLVVRFKFTGTWK